MDHPHRARHERDALTVSVGVNPTVVTHPPVQAFDHEPQSRSSSTRRHKSTEHRSNASRHGRRAFCQSSRTPAEPDPYIQRRFAITLAVALECWSFYAVVGRVCTPMIRNQSSSGLPRSVGVGTLIGFIPIWLVMMWSYIKITFTGPGLATKVLSKSPLPLTSPSVDYVPYRPPVGTQSVNEYPARQNQAAPDPSEFAPIHNILTSNPREAPTLHDGTAQVDTLVIRPVPHVDCAPRWCRFCEINKPDRTHHCRHCGMCIMQFDHHCVWIGQCVGWANHKFFINFTFWTSVYCLYIIILLVVTTTKASTPDGQTIGAIAVAALFGLFTSAMLTTHIDLILTGRTTVESFQGQDQRREEATVLQKEFGYLWRNIEKRQVQRRWKAEWGGSPVDARWRHGTARQMWEQEMGKNPLGWFLPIGRPLGDGLHFPSNPRFGPNGEWLRKRDWPKDVV